MEWNIPLKTMGMANEIARLKAELAYCRDLAKPTCRGDPLHSTPLGLSQRTEAWERKPSLVAEDDIEQLAEQLADVVAERDALAVQLAKAEAERQPPRPEGRGILRKLMKTYSDIELLAELINRNFTRLMLTPKNRQFVSPHVGLCVGIGKDHTADITIDVDALSELKRLTES